MGRAVLEKPSFFFVEDHPQGPPLRTAFKGILKDTGPALAVVVPVLETPRKAGVPMLPRLGPPLILIPVLSTGGPQEGRGYVAIAHFWAPGTAGAE